MAPLSSTVEWICPIPGLGIGCLCRWRPVRNWNLRVRPEGEVFLSVPPGTSKAQIERFLVQRCEWIQRSLQRVQLRQNSRRTELCAQSGTTLFYLGHAYPVQTIFSKQPGWEIRSNTWVWKFPAGKSEEWQHKWMKRLWVEEAKQQFEKSLERLRPFLEAFGLALPQLRCRMMRSRWGSCTPSAGRICLNAQLLHFGADVIDSVVLHELAHFIHANHSQAFWHIVYSWMPDYRQRQIQLKE